MGGSPRQIDLGHRHRTANAGVAGSAVNAQVVLKSAFQAGAADVIADSAAPLANRVLKHLFDRQSQRLGLGRLQIATAQNGSQAGPKERFVGVDISHTRHNPLV